MTTQDQQLRRYLDRAIEEFTAGKQTHRWMIGELLRAGLRGKALEELLDSHKGKDASGKLTAIVRECQARGWM